MTGKISNLPNIVRAFRRQAGILLQPQPVLEVYRPMAKILPSAGAVIFSGMTYFDTPQLQGIWAVGAALATGALVKGGARLGETIFGQIPAMIVDTIAGCCKAQGAPGPTKNRITFSQTATAAGALTLAWGGLVGMSGGAVATYIVAKPVVTFIAESQQRPVGRQLHPRPNLQIV